MSVENECGLASPATGQLCTMFKGHFGPHKAGGPYHSVEDWVVRCSEGCTYQENTKTKLLAGCLHRVKWKECPKCGHIIKCGQVTWYPEFQGSKIGFCVWIIAGKLWAKTKYGETQWRDELEFQVQQPNVSLTACPA